MSERSVPTAGEEEVAPEARFLALAAWETEKRRPPVIALAATAAIWLTFKTLQMRTGMAPMLMYLAWTLPLGAVLVRELFAKPARVRTLVPALAG